MCKLKINKKKESKIEIAYIAVVGSFNAFSPYLLPLANSLNFNFSFSILPDIISNNTPIPFLWNILNSLLVFISFLLNFIK